MPRHVADVVQQELEDWATLGVAAHFDATVPWFSYHEVFRETGALLVGARPGEVVMMNSLTVNLHLMMASFYRPSGTRFRILMEESAFPSDRYAVASHVQWRGYDPTEAVVVATPAEGDALTIADFERVFSEAGDSLALVLLGGVNFFTGQLYDLQKICEMGHSAGCIVGYDLAHAAGNVPLALHEWGVDFAVWCSYKYLNAGPGAVGGCFVHERYGQDKSIPRLAGWWGNEPATRFQMTPDFQPRAGAEGWQLSNPPILSMAPLRVSLEMFNGAGMRALREKSIRLTGYLASLLGALEFAGVHVTTPGDPAARGCQLSIRLPVGSADVVDALSDRGIVVDYRPPDIVRVAPVPLYNSFNDVLRFVTTLADLLNVDLNGATPR
jgi:kynureninase